eukprot:470216-Heterocapsa_arctica.AAC.1
MVVLLRTLPRCSWATWTSQCRLSSGVAIEPLYMAFCETSQDQSPGHCGSQQRLRLQGVDLHGPGCEDQALPAEIADGRLAM